MKITNIVTILLITMILISCAPVATVIPTETAVPTSTFTPIPPTATSMPTLTPVPTPMGGSTLRVAFYASISNNMYLVVGNYFSRKIDYKILLRNYWPEGISWSPDGAHLLFIDMGLDDMKVNLLDVKTGKVVTLSTFPSLASDGKVWNKLMNIQWSTDSKYILYRPWADTQQRSTTHVASVDGIVQMAEGEDGEYSDWLADTRILIDTSNGGTYDLDKEVRDPFRASVFFHIKIRILELTRDFIILDSDTITDRLEATLYPEDLADPALWTRDALLKNKVTLFTFAPEIKDPEIFVVLSITELPDHQLAIQGFGNFEVRDKQYQYFRVVVDKENLPAIVKEENLYGTPDENGFPSESPVAFSPDGQLVLLQTVVLHKDRTFSHIKLTLRDTQRRELRTDVNLSQFSSAIKTLPGAEFAFYWQP